MKIYEANFIGRLSTSIGVCYRITEMVYAENKAKAELELYDKYDHIQHLTLIESEV